tara:strand:- start:3548 stop:4348 length:801 start_codon:yes stop_codon:yes gene_type:complete
MDHAAYFDGSDQRAERKPTIRFLVEAALRNVTRSPETEAPAHCDSHLAHLVEALTARSEARHVGVVASLIARGVRRREIMDTYIPAAARRLGDLWVADKASFVDVTVGVGRLQAMVRDHADAPGGRTARVDATARSFLMIVPEFEDHSLGAILAADQLRRQGVPVRLGIRLPREDLAALVAASDFAALGLSVATAATLEKAAQLIDYLRSNLDAVPPVMLGGRAVRISATAAELTGADHAVKTAHDAIMRCDLSMNGNGPGFEALR